MTDCSTFTFTSASASPLASVIIPFYNCPYVDQAVASVLNQTYPNVEIIVVDDGSTRHQEKLGPFLPRIRYFGKANGGTASALNFGLRLARGEYIAWLSSDDLMVPGKIASQIAWMRRTGAPVSFTDYHLVNNANEITQRSVTVKFPTLRAFVESLLHFCPVNGSTVMMHRTVPDIVGYFTENLACTQDYEYWIRVHLSRLDFQYINEIGTLYRWHDGMGTVQQRTRVDLEFRSVRERFAPQVHALLATL